ncbi:MAG: pseudouridine-5-phosphate glycosidase, partial [Gammaproteobacteria bacterium]|nr:pseudouridine-5-phosphate glycosidase [Gammaproteobacteria bacterium]
LDSAEQIAALMAARKNQHSFSHGGILITNPVPAESEIPRDEMSVLIAQAQQEAADKGIKGKEVTPWLLGRILEISDGKSLVTNVALVKNNAKLAAQIAVKYAEAADI